MELFVGAELVERIMGQAQVSPYGIHGLGHWARVLLNGTLLAESTGADLQVVQLFALFHDSRREHDGTDPGHGRRGAALAEAQRGSWFQLSDSGMSQLWDACAFHSDGLVEHEDATVRTCWDADRLDLSRVWITPRPELLATQAAREPSVLQAAILRGREGVIPDFVCDAWGLEAPPRRSQGT